MLNANAQWADNNVENLNLLGEKTIYGFDMKVAPDGSYYFYYAQPDGFITNNLQRYDKDGVKQWDNDLRISDEATLSWTQVNENLLVDRGNNAIIMVSDVRLEPVYDTNSTIGQGITYSLYKVSPDGEQLWGEDGILLTPKPLYIRADIKAMQLTDGSYIFAWFNTSNNSSSISLQRVSTDGELMWEEKEISGGTPYLVDAGDDEFLLAFASNGIRVRKYDFNGDAMWTEDAIVYTGGGFGMAPLYTNLEVSAANGGAILGWHDDRDGDQRYDAYCAYIKSDGTHGFSAGEGGQKIAYSELGQTQVAMAFDEANSCVYASITESSGSSWHKMTSQKLSLDGQLLWSPAGKELIKIDKRSVGYHSMQLGPRNTVCTFFTETTVSYKHTIVYASLQNTDGSFAWEDSIVSMASILSLKSPMVSTPLKNNQWICVWSDNRISGKIDEGGAFAQNISIDGVLGKVKENVSNESIINSNNNIELSIFPNPATSNINIEINNDLKVNSSATIDIIDISGRCVKNIYKGIIYNEKTSIQYNIEELSPGIYFVKIVTSTGTQTAKLIVK